MIKALNDSDRKRLRKQLAKLMGELRQGAIFVEGKRDVEALRKLGCGSIFTVSGNLRLSCEKVQMLGVQKVIILTDRDERGNELALEARSELERYGIKADLEVRIALSRILGIWRFENAHRAYEKFMKELDV